MAKRKNNGTDLTDTDDFAMAGDNMDDILGSDEEEISNIYNRSAAVGMVEPDKIFDKDMFYAHKKKVKELFLNNKINRCIGWEVYRSIHKIPFNEHIITNRYYYIEDGTDDIDYPEDYENFKKEKEKCQ